MRQRRIWTCSSISFVVQPRWRSSVRSLPRSAKRNALCELNPHLFVIWRKVIRFCICLNSSGAIPRTSALNSPLRSCRWSNRSNCDSWRLRPICASWLAPGMAADIAVITIREAMVLVVIFILLPLSKLYYRILLIVSL